jgi:hypothetical protein
MWRRIATVRTSRQQCPDAILIIEIVCSRVTTIQTLGQHRLNAALIWKREAHYGKAVAQLSGWMASAYVWTRPRENRINVDLGLL